VVSKSGNHRFSNIVSTILLLYLGLLIPPVVLAGEEEEAQQESGLDAQSDKLQPTIPNENALELGRVSGDTLMTQAELCVKSRNFDKAIQFARRSIQENGDDADLHRIYAEALEGKLQSQKEKDPTLFKECVEEWLSVLRSGYGEERGLNVKGAGGVFDFLYRDDERYIVARHHLHELTGVLPKPWETNAGYMKRVLKPKPGVKGALMDEEKKKP
jgi:hypothetical protein